MTAAKVRLFQYKISNLSTMKMWLFYGSQFNTLKVFKKWVMLLFTSRFTLSSSDYSFIHFLRKIWRFSSKLLFQQFPNTFLFRCNTIPWWSHKNCPLFKLCSSFCSTAKKSSFEAERPQHSLKLYFFKAPLLFSLFFENLKFVVKVAPGHKDIRGYSNNTWYSRGSVFNVFVIKKVFFVSARSDLNTVDFV